MKSSHDLFNPLPRELFDWTPAQARADAMPTGFDDRDAPAFTAALDRPNDKRTETT